MKRILQTPIPYYNIMLVQRGQERLIYFPTSQFRHCLMDKLSRIKSSSEVTFNHQRLLN